MAENILGKNYKSIVIGCFEKDEIFYWVQLFGIANLIFGYKYYADKYPDFKTAFGCNEAAYNYFISNGYKELRKSSNLYWGEYYKNNNSD